MTSEVTQAASEPCPNLWCNSRKTVDCEIRAAEDPILMPSSSGAEWAVACPVCPLQTPYFDTESEAIAEWNTRPTAQSGEGISLPTQRMAETLGARFVISGEGRSGAGEDLRAAAQAVLDNADREGSRMHFESGPNGEDVWIDHKEVDVPVLDALAAALNARRSGEGERKADFRGRAISEAIELIDELNERATSRKFWGISQTMHSKLCTIRATLLRAALRATDDAGGA